MLNKWKSKGLRERVEMLRGPKLLLVVHQRIVLRYKTSLSLRIGFLILIIIREGILAHPTISLLVPSVEKGMKEND